MSRRYTNEAIAEVCDNAHDYMLAHGWTRGMLSNPATGEVCIMGAVWNGTWDHDLRYVVTDAIDTTLNSMPGAVGRSGLRTNCVYFNDTQAESVDDVLELLRQTSKRLREVTGASD